MVHTAANLDCLLLKHTHTRSGLACVEHVCLCALKTLHILGCHCGNAAHALHNVKHKALCLEQRAHLAGNHHSDVALLDVCSIVDEHFHLHSGVETCEHALCHLNTSEDAILLNQQVRLAHSCIRNTTKGCVVAIAYILCKREVDKAVFQFVYTKHNLFLLFVIIFVVTRLKK